MPTPTPGTGDLVPNDPNQDVSSIPNTDVIGPNLDDTVLASDTAEQIAVDDPNNPPQPSQTETVRIGTTPVNQDSH